MLMFWGPYNKDHHNHNSLGVPIIRIIIKIIDWGLYWSPPIWGNSKAGSRGLLYELQLAAQGS